MALAIRPAESTDAERMVHLCEQAYHRLESHRDAFYATGPNLLDELRTSLMRLLGSEERVAFVAEDADEIGGLLVGRLVSAPPVYDPGGKVLLVEHLLAAEPSAWPKVGPKLIEAADDGARRLGGILTTVECRRHDDAKRRFLLAHGFTVASDWLYRDANLPTTVQGAGEIRVAEPEDVPAIVALCEQSRQRYETYQPVFWRKATDSAERQTPYLRSLIEGKTQIVLVHRTAGRIDGAIVANPNAFAPFYDLRGSWCSTDDFAVADESTWETVGFRLLVESVRRSLGTGYTQVICAEGDKAKLRMLWRLGYAVGHEWLVRKTLT